MELRLTGLASNFDWEPLVEQLTELERVPQQRLRAEQSILQQRNTAYGAIVTQLQALKTKIDALKDPTLFSARQPKVGDAGILSAVATGSAALGTYTFDILQLATAASQRGTVDIGQKLSATNDVSGLVLSDASFGLTVTAGTFTVNGQQITVATDDTLQDVFDSISNATGGAVTGSYDSTTDKITLSSGGPIVLGSATDSSNFLLASKLYNNGTGTISSAFALGVIRTSSTLANATFATPVSDGNGGSGGGEFKVNGVSISFNATTDTVADVLGRINNSNAGVTASYDSVNDRFILTNKTTGDVGIALEDVSGNFLAATGLTAGTLSHGRNLLYTVNGGEQLTSLSNTITESSSAIPGLTVTALAEGSTTVEVTSDTAKIKTAITDFITEYNKTQALIDSHTASSTDAKGKVTAGILTSETEATELRSKLRGLVNGVVSGLGGSIKQLAALGINSNGNDDNIALTDSAKLDAALASDLNGVTEVFSSTNGVATTLSAYLDHAVGEEGSLVDKRENLTKQSTNIDTQVADLERKVLANREHLISTFIAMEQAQARINQQLQFLLQRFGSTS